METELLVTNIIAGASGLISLGALFVAGLSYREVGSIQAKTAQAQVELSIQTLIVDAEGALRRVADDMMAANASGQVSPATISLLQAQLDTAKERYANAVEQACGFYLDKKVDRVRFKKNYFDSFRRLVLDSDFDKFYGSSVAPCKATLKVYREWDPAKE